MRLLLDGSRRRSPGATLTDPDLAQLYAAPAPRWLRANVVATLDGAASGADGLSGSINTPADTVVFDLLRAQSDVVVVGAGTARIEGYTPLAVAPRWRDHRRATGRPDGIPLAVVSESARLPDRLAQGGPDPDSIVLVTHADAPHLADAIEILGPAHVLRCGTGSVDLAMAVAMLRDRGFEQILTEGGPRLLGALVAADLVDEVCLSLVPRLVAGDGPRVLAAPPVDLAVEPHLLVEQDGTVMGRWIRAR